MGEGIIMHISWGLFKRFKYSCFMLKWSWVHKILFYPFFLKKYVNFIQNMDFYSVWTLCLWTIANIHRNHKFIHALKIFLFLCSYDLCILMLFPILIFSCTHTENTMVKLSSAKETIFWSNILGNKCNLSLI